MGQRICSCDSAPCCQRNGDAHSNLLGALIASLVTCFDSSLGLEVTVGSLDVNPESMEVEVQDLTINNPLDGSWKSDHILHCKKLLVNISAVEFIKSWGKEVLVQELLIKGVDLIYEPALGSSNFAKLQEKLGGPAQADEKQKVKLQKVDVEDVGLKVYVHGIGPRLSLADIRYDDFDKEHGGVSGFMEIVFILLSTVMKSVAFNLEGVAAGAADATKSVMHRVLPGKLQRFLHICPHTGEPKE
eukprot:TRINITY_DN106167_c0_g1_i1.p1 TRINITY_DN106167_c0_g1~~TRINITY_DN106167_c0_g1_i1.p1  ORF type:complete len:244 (-),score=55.28 TRINITY_DN106167_c0_g1_i1:120-851(-)